MVGVIDGVKDIVGVTLGVNEIVGVILGVGVLVLVGVKVGVKVGVGVGVGVGGHKPKSSTFREFTPPVLNIVFFFAHNNRFEVGNKIFPAIKLPLQST